MHQAVGSSAGAGRGGGLSFSEHTDFIADFAYQVWPLSSHALPLFVWAGMHHQSTAMNLLGRLSVISSHDAICTSSHSRGL